MTNRKKPPVKKPRGRPAKVKPQPKEQLPAVATKHPFRPRKIEPSDHAKFYVVKEKGKEAFVLPLDKHESKKKRQLDVARARGLINSWMDGIEKNKEEMTPLNFKQLTDAMKNLDEIEEKAYDNDVPIRPRTGNSEPDDLDELMANAVKAGMKVKERQMESAARNKPIDVEADDV